MASTESNNTEDNRIQALLGNYLATRGPAGASPVNSTASHLDQDTISAFVEGSISEREAAPAVKHLAGCSYCRHITADLVRLDLAFADEAVPLIQESVEPSRISEVLNGILKRIFGSGDAGAVFAHNEKDDKEPSDKDADDQESNKEK